METKAGIPRYRGQALGFSEWKFKVEGRLIAIENQAEYEDDSNLSKRKTIELGSRVVDGLEDEALKIAMELGHAELATPQFVRLLIVQFEEANPMETKMTMPENSTT